MNALNGQSVSGPLMTEDGNINVPWVLSHREDSQSMTLKSDGSARVVLDDEGQGYVEVAGGTRSHSMWACVVCAIPTGGQHRECRTHGAKGNFLKHIREKAADDV